jgi:hypothetical protein
VSGSSRRTRWYVRGATSRAAFRRALDDVVLDGERPAQPAVTHVPRRTRRAGSARTQIRPSCGACAGHQLTDMSEICTSATGYKRHRSCATMVMVFRKRRLGLIRPAGVAIAHALNGDSRPPRYTTRTSRRSPAVNFGARAAATEPRNPWIVDLAPAAGSILQEVCDGLSQRRSGCRQNSYDPPRRACSARSAAPRYYPTRTENAILDRRAVEIAGEIGTDGPHRVWRRPDRKSVGCCRLDPRLCWADISGSAGAGCSRLALDYPWLAVIAVIGDYSSGRSQLSLPHTRRVVFPAPRSTSSPTRRSRSAQGSCSRRIAGNAN